MDYTEILAIAEHKLVPDHEGVLNEIRVRIRSGSTGGEIGSMVGGYLKDLREQNNGAYLIMKADMDLYLSQFIWKK